MHICLFSCRHLCFHDFFVIHPRRIDWLIVCVCDGIHTWGLMNVAVCAILDKNERKLRLDNEKVLYVCTVTEA